MGTKEPITPMADIRKYVNEKKMEMETKEKKDVVSVAQEKKSITDLSAKDIEFTVDKNKSVEQQAEDVVGAIATANAVQDKVVAKELTEKKADELLAKAEAKKKQAEAESIKAETEKQKEKRTLYEGVLEHFAIKKHLPFWLMIILTAILSPLFVVMTILIGTPFAIVKTVMDCLDNVVCRYEEIGETAKPKVRMSIWVLLVLIVIAGILLTVLKCFNAI